MADQEQEHDGPHGFLLEWTIPGNRGGEVTFEIEGEVSLFNNNRAYRINGMLYIARGEMYCNEIGNPHLFVRRNGTTETGHRWGWEVITHKKSCRRLYTMEVHFVRTGYWAPEDRSVLLGIGADPGWRCQPTYSRPIEIALHP
jgi:hypothetical protein